MAFNPMAHMSELVFENVDFGVLLGKPPSSITLPDGQTIASAQIGHPETITYWMQGPDNAFHQVTEDQQFAENLWLNFAYGQNMAAGQEPLLQALNLEHSYHVTSAALLAAITATPVLRDALAARGYSDADVLAYVADHAPGVLIVGQP
jgi:hypothetical protein